MPGPAHVDDQAGQGLERRAGVLQGGGVAAHHQREGALLGAGRAARQRRVEVAGAGGGHPLVLGPLHVGVDGRAVDDDLARPEGGQHGVDHLDHLGGVGHAEEDDLAGRRPRRPACRRRWRRGPRPRRSVPGCATPPSPGGRPRRRWRVMGRPMAPRPTKPSFMRSSSCDLASPVRTCGRLNCGSQRAVPASSSSTMASVSCRSPRPARGSRAKAASASARSPVRAASTVISCTATWRRSSSANGGGQRGPRRGRGCRRRRRRRSTRPPRRRAGRGTGPALGMLSGQLAAGRR